jgi:hypothetical protein
VRVMHGLSASRTFYTHRTMVARCRDERSIGYPRYGARGVTVCDRWAGPGGLLNFVEDMGVRPDGMTIDRIDGSKGYEPGNCRWATDQTQGRNKRSVVLCAVSVCLIRHMSRRRQRTDDVAHAFGISSRHVRELVTYHSWKNITGIDFSITQAGGS